MAERIDLHARGEADCEGSCFDYSRSPDLFMRKTGWGPLNVAWDTGILIDFAAYGRAILDGEFKPPSEMDPDRANEVTALQVLLDVGWARDIRVYVCGLQEFDARNRSPKIGSSFVSANCLR